VVVESVDFADSPGVTELCRSAIAGASDDEFVFFFARGSATPSEAPLRLVHPRLDDVREVRVEAITGRVEEQ